MNWTTDDPLPIRSASRAVNYNHVTSNIARPSDTAKGQRDLPQR